MSVKTEELRSEHFREILKHLSRKRVDDVEISTLENNFLQFTVKNKWFEKFFTVHYRDGFSEDDSLAKERPRGFYYYMQFEQPNFPQKGYLVEIGDWNWYQTEDDVIDAVRRFCRNWRR